MVKIDCRRAVSRLFGIVSKATAAGRLQRLAFAPVPHRRERGQTLLEFALIFPVMLLFLLIFVDFGIALDRREVLQHAVREGARKGATGADVADIQQVTSDQSQGSLDPGEVIVCYLDTDSNGQFGNVGDDVRVSANVTYTFTAGGTEIIGAFGAPIPSIPMSPSADIRVEQTTVTAGPAC